MQRFSGFLEEKNPPIPVPGVFFRELLPQIDDLNELKITLYFFGRMSRLEGAFHYLQEKDILADSSFIQGFGKVDGDAAKELDAALSKAVERGTILSCAVTIADRHERLYFLNTPRGRAAAAAIERGEWRYTGDLEMPVEVLGETPNIYRLYEDNIGPLTPLIAEALSEAEDTYPARWIEEAIGIAVQNNARSWRYVAAILARWQSKGRYERKDRRDTEKARRRYSEWEE